MESQFHFCSAFPDILCALMYPSCWTLILSPVSWSDQFLNLQYKPACLLYSFNFHDCKSTITLYGMLLPSSVTSVRCSQASLDHIYIDLRLLTQVKDFLGTPQLLYFFAKDASVDEDLIPEHLSISLVKSRTLV